jgi:PST family polysaccharide transporter
LRANTVVAAITVPTLLGLIAVTPDFVHAVLGSHWSSATPVIRILAWVGLLQSVQGLNSSVLRAVDQTRTLFRYSVVVLVASLIAFGAGLHWGIVGVATGYAISSSFVEPYYSWVTAKSVGLSLLDFVRPLAGVVAAAVAMCVAVLAAHMLLVRVGFPATPRLLLEVGLGIAVYVPTCAWRAAGLRAELREVVRRRRSRLAVPTSGAVLDG